MSATIGEILIVFWLGVFVGVALTIGIIGTLAVAETMKQKSKSKGAEQ